MTDLFHHLIEGVVEQDPMTDRYYIRSADSDGKPVNFDPLDALAKHKGQEVRFILVSFENLAKLAALVERAGGVDAQVTGLAMDNLPGAEVKRKP
jgi:hypothetical protein